MTPADSMPGRRRGGAVRDSMRVNVAQYQEQHRHLFDRVWDRFYARVA